jgi:hypothetical protein
LRIIKSPESAHAISVTKSMSDAAGIVEGPPSASADRPAPEKRRIDFWYLPKPSRQPAFA